MYCLLHTMQVLKVWELVDHTCVQTVLVPFPTSLHGRLPEHGPFSLHLQTPNPSSHQAPHHALLLTANDYIALLKVGSDNDNVASAPTTHSTQLSAAIYNPFFKQVCALTQNIFAMNFNIPF